MDIDAELHVNGTQATAEITPPWDGHNPEYQATLYRAQRAQRPRSSDFRPSLTSLSVYDQQRRLDNDAESRSIRSTISGTDEEAEVIKMNRMLKDPAGRLRKPLSLWASFAIANMEHSLHWRLSDLVVPPANSTVRLQVSGNFALYG
jgi:hypothetical protein